MLGQPPNPPPPDIPAIEPDVRGTTTLREMLAKRRSSAVCASCHKKIDPPGFALQSYDPIGAWQTRYRALGSGQPTGPVTPGRPAVPSRLGQLVDAPGETAAGRPFTDITGFKKPLLHVARPIARNIVGRLVTYPTGAPVR